MVAEGKPKRHKRWWTTEEDTYLRSNWGRRSPVLIARDLGRTRRAVSARAQALKLTANDDEDRSLTAFAKYSGFSRTKVKNAAAAIGLKLRRGLRTRVYKHRRNKASRIPESVKSQRWYVPSEHEDELLAYLLEHADERIYPKKGRS